LVSSDISEMLQVGCPFKHKAYSTIKIIGAIPFESLPGVPTIIL
jgi:hypothetical protein